MARYLFVPLAEAVVFAMLASYVLSRTLVPTLAMYLLRAKDHVEKRSRNPLVLFQRGFERFFEKCASAISGRADDACVAAQGFRSALSVGLRSGLLYLIPFLGRRLLSDQR